MEFRYARPSDAPAVARLHAESWRRAYRGTLPDKFLDGPVFNDRLAQWRGRLTEPQPETQGVLLLEEKGMLWGFGCVFLDANPKWGALLDNLHVLPAVQGRGLGRRLMGETAAWVLERRPDSGLYLLVFATNQTARDFYERLGGQAVEQFPHPGPGGTKIETVRYVWPDLRPLAVAAAGPIGGNSVPVKAAVAKA
ncbi:MAG: N-acetyltransferase [Thermodesulfobacteriota bacterium]